MSDWSGEVPVVSVLVPVFNHRKWIEDCLNGILAQETNFPFVVLVRDDASTDGTREVLLQWRDRYPNILKLTMNNTNLIACEDPIVGLLPLVQTKYVAYCEGDDYWCLPDKLQRQIEVLERSSDVICVSHGKYVLKEGSNAWYADSDVTVRFPRGSMRPVHLVPSLSMTFRAPGIFPTEAIQAAPFGDVVLKAVLASEGAIIHEGNYLGAVYRVHSRGAFNGLQAPEANVKSVVSRIIAAHELAERGEKGGATNLLTDATKQLLTFSDEHFGTQSALAVHKVTSLRHRVGIRLRSRVRGLPLLRSLYFKLRRRSDPLRTDNS